MLHTLTGNIITQQEQLLFFSIGPIVLQIHIPSNSIFLEKNNVTIYSYFHWHEENGPSLFGFHDHTNKELFILLISCSGIGPKIALNILGSLGSENLIASISHNNIQALSSVPGIGTKKAEQLILHTKDKLSKLIEKGTINPSHNNINWHQLTEALKTLGYSRTEIQKVTTTLNNKKEMINMPFEQLMRAALALLIKKPQS